MKNILQVLIIQKAGKQSYKINKFPFYIGSGKAVNIITVHESNLLDKHFEIISAEGKIFIKNLSGKVIYMQNKILNLEKVVLDPGINRIRFGNAKIYIKLNQNMGGEENGTKRQKSFSQDYLKVRYVVPAVVILLFAVALVFISTEYIFTGKSNKDDSVKVVQGLTESTSTSSNFNVAVTYPAKSSIGWVSINIEISDHSVPVSDLKNYIISLNLSTHASDKSDPAFTVNSIDNGQRVSWHETRNSLIVTKQLLLNTPGTKNILLTVTRPKDKKSVERSFQINIEKNHEFEIPVISQTYQEEDVAVTPETEVDKQKEQPEKKVFIPEEKEVPVIEKKSEQTTVSGEVDSAPRNIRAKWQPSGFILDITSINDFVIESHSAEGTADRTRQISERHYQIVFKNRETIPNSFSIKIKGFKKPITVQKPAEE
ncbi:MAG: hypothetical protein IPJ03_01600 [Ignavibacteriales bacterium]|nr:hypothetical protein [Ignavibacteriales bacterium]